MSGLTSQPRQPNILPLRPKAGDHFIGNQQHAVFVTDLPDQGPVIVRRHDHAAGALHRFGDKRRDRVRSLVHNFPLQQVGADLSQFLGIFRVGIAVQPGAVNLETTRQDRLVHGTQVHLAADGGAAEMDPVVALFQ